MQRPLCPTSLFCGYLETLTQTLARPARMAGFLLPSSRSPGHVADPLTLHYSGFGGQNQVIT
jgi:hypothetical protein